MLTHERSGGFTLVEVVVALVILSTAVLGLGASASRLATATATGELRALALQAVDDQIARIRLDPRYGGLDTLYTGVETDLFDIDGMTRTTTVTHVQETTPLVLDYKRISVTVDGPLITETIARQIVIAAP
jgi:prepilin-type N-terminal cleavage/methylation domain-containing protein